MTTERVFRVGAARVMRRINAAMVEDEGDDGRDCVLVFTIRSLLGC